MRALEQAILRRCHGVLDWYNGCDVCPETLENVNRELGGVLTAALRDVGCKRELPYVLRARFNGAELIVTAVPWSVS